MLQRIYRSEADLRKQQINTLKIFNDNVNEIKPGNEYQIPFQSGNHELTLQILLNNEFPTNSKPILKINPIVNHHWVNGDGEIKSAPGLLQFTVHSDLGRVVQAIIREFERIPPPIIDGQSNCPGPSVVAIVSKPDDHSSPKYSPPNIHPPLFNHVFPNLNKLSIDELEFLNENVDRQLEFLGETPAIKEQNRLIDELILQAEELAEQNLSKETELDVKRRNLEERIETVTKLAFENERLHVEYQSLSDRYSPKNIQEQLKAAAQEADRECDHIAEKFLNGEMDVDKFLSNFIKMRTLSQLRKTKEEKLSEQLERLEKAGF